MSLAVYFLLPREKKLLYVIRLNQEAMKTTLGGGGILWSKTSSPPTSGGGRSPLKSAFWWVIYRRKILRKYIFLYKEQFSFNFVCLIWFWLHYVFAALSTILPSILYTVSWKGKDFVCFLLSMEHHFCVKQNVFGCLVFLLSTERVLFCCLVFLLSTGRVFLLSCVLAVDWKSFFAVLCFCCSLEKFFCCLVQFKGTVYQDIVFWAQWKEKTFNISAEGFNIVWYWIWESPSGTSSGLFISFEEYTVKV